MNENATPHNVHQFGTAVEIETGPLSDGALLLGADDWKPRSNLGDGSIAPPGSSLSFDLEGFAGPSRSELITPPRPNKKRSIQEVTGGEEEVKNPRRNKKRSPRLRTTAHASSPQVDIPDFDRILRLDGIPCFDDIHHIDNLDSRGARDADAANGLWFACPFSKRDHWMHPDCLEMKFKTYPHVYQHLKRRHIETKYRCKKCHKEWNEGDEDAQTRYDNHIRHNSCQEAIEPAGGWKKAVCMIKNCQWVKSKAEPKAADAAKWYCTWGKLFGPNAPKPASPYYQGHWAVCFSLFWAGFSHGRQTAPQAIQPERAQAGNLHATALVSPFMTMNGSNNPNPGNSMLERYGSQLGLSSHMGTGFLGMGPFNYSFAGQEQVLSALPAVVMSEDVANCSAAGFQFDGSCDVLD